MANHLQALAVVLAAPVIGAAADFSHALHLKLVRDCTNCHTAAAASTRVDDNLLPSAAVCRPCHGERTVRSKPMPTSVATFDHSLHVKVVPKGCVGCHLGLEQSARVTREAFPPMVECLACHTKIDPPYSCAECHSPAMELKPASHTPEWGDLHTNPKIGKQGCWVCHGKRFTCQGCH